MVKKVTSKGLGKARRQLGFILNREVVENTVLSSSRGTDDIVFGGRAIKKHIGLFARPTEDFDIFTKNPKKKSQKVENKLDKLTPGDDFYVKKGKNPGTWKVKDVGPDFEKGTRDDKGIADYTKTPKPRPSSTVINGVRYRALSEEIKAKKRTAKDPQFAFRKEKDLNDLSRIKLATFKFL